MSNHNRHKGKKSERQIFEQKAVERTNSTICSIINKANEIVEQEVSSGLYFKNKIEKTAPIIITKNKYMIHATPERKNAPQYMENITTIKLNINEISVAQKNQLKKEFAHS